MKALFSRIANSRIVYELIVFLAIALACYMIRWPEMRYVESLEMKYLFMHMLLRLLEEKYLLLALSVLIWEVVIEVIFRETERRYKKMILCGYVALWVIIFSGLSIRMNRCYELNRFPVRTAEIFCRQVGDMVLEEEVTFYMEPCEIESDRVIYWVFSPRGIYVEEEWYSYLCLNNQRDKIPIASEFVTGIRDILEETGGVCNITCYKNSHIITAINGMELTGLR
uniref:hypothetical protein n=1 Tax=Acetatifactor sp. TaxID=1872090 RepID=UPI0040573369